MSNLWKDPFTCRNYANIRESIFKNEHVFLDYLMSKLSNRSVALDLCCGIELHAEYLSNRMKSVIGVDSSPIMIEYANRRKPANVELIEGDLQTISLNQKVDLVGFFYGSLVFSDENTVEKVLAISIQHLEEDGLLVVDNRNFSFMEELVGTRNWVEREQHYELQEYIQKSDCSTITTITNYIFKNKLMDSYKVSLEARYYQMEELEQILKCLNMEIVETFGDYDLSPYDLTESPRMILICRRRMINEE